MESGSEVPFEMAGSLAGAKPAERARWQVDLQTRLQVPHSGCLMVLLFSGSKQNPAGVTTEVYYV